MLIIQRKRLYQKVTSHLHVYESKKVVSASEQVFKFEPLYYCVAKRNKRLRSKRENSLFLTYSIWIVWLVESGMNERLKPLFRKLNFASKLTWQKRNPKRFFIMEASQQVPTRFFRVQPSLCPLTRTENSLPDTMEGWNPLSALQLDFSKIPSRNVFRLQNFHWCVEIPKLNAFFKSLAH